jgi:hypothetical protein
VYIGLGFFLPSHETLILFYVIRAIELSISVSQSVCYIDHYMFRSWLTIIHTTQISYIGKHGTNRKYHLTKSNHGVIHPQYTEYPYSQKSINRCALTSSDHTGVVRNFQILHTNISRSACICIRMETRKTE